MYLSDTESEGTSTSTASTEPFEDEMPALETPSSASQESPYQQQDGQGRRAGWHEVRAGAARQKLQREAAVGKPKVSLWMIGQDSKFVFK